LAQAETNNNVVNIKVDQDVKQKGHGRMAHTAYLNTVEIYVKYEGLDVGDFCPLNCDGKLYLLKPGIVIRVVGNSLATVNKYSVERLRCALCCAVFKAMLPEGAGSEKYDAKFKAIIATQKYYIGVPFYRQANFQSYMNLPLPASVQYELSESVADCGYPIVGVLEKGVANDKYVHNDDTHVKILSVIKDNIAHPDKERTGMFTSCIMGKMEGHSVALYYTGTKHAGENLELILQHRAVEKPAIIQMCDALSANLPKAIKTILCNCLGHGFRKFTELLDFYPEPCLHVIRELSIVFKNDEKTREMTEQERFQFHRQHSKPIMLKLHGWLKQQLTEKRVEPNSSLGKAMKYLLRHWKKLRRFLVVPGCPINNNVVERALKIPIRVRKTAMFYKTEHGATIGSILTTLIHTAALSSENPVEYLVALQENKSKIFKDPAAWVPWRYRETLRTESLHQAA
jgi:transposase